MTTIPGGPTPVTVLPPGAAMGPLDPLIQKVGQMLRRIFPPEQEDIVFAADKAARGLAAVSQTAPAEHGSLAAWADEKMRIEAGRAAAYKDYDQMDEEQPELSAALDVISEFATQTDESAVDTFNITSDSPQTANQLDAIATRLKLKHMATPLAREIVKYGCSFLETVCAPSGDRVSGSLDASRSGIEDRHRDKRSTGVNGSTKE